MELQTAAARRSTHLAEKKESQILESKKMNDSAIKVPPRHQLPLKVNHSDINVIVSTG
jgi:hypothetical protein